jgi:DNA-directed RNA polymerase specialized sigma subunit
MANKNEFYVNNAEFQQQLITFFDTNDKAIKEKIGKIFMIIAQRILNKPCFINYTKDRKDDMISDATFFMVKYIDRYDPNRGNPFAFFSQIAFNAFRQNINKTKKRNTMFVPLTYLDNVGSETPND